MNVFLSFLVFLVCWLAPVADGQSVEVRMPIDGYAATVNERIITIGEVRSATAEKEMQLRMRYAGAELARKQMELFLSGLDQVIDRALILEEYEAQKLQLPDRLIDNEINDIVAAEYKGDRAAMLGDLADQQMTIEEWREAIRDRIIISMMRSREIGERIVVSPRQIIEAYEARQDLYHEPAKVHLRLIFKRGGTDAEANLTALQEIRTNILAGQAFAEAAIAGSEDPSAANGGDWGWVQPDQFRDELKNAIANVATGEISEIVETPEGLYLLLVEERREATTRSLEEVRAEIETDLRRRQGEELMTNWLARLRNKYAVIYHIPVPPPDQP